MDFSTKEDGTTFVEVPSTNSQMSIVRAKLVMLKKYQTYVEGVLKNAITEEQKRDLTTLSPFVLLFGPPGIGKTASIYQIAYDLNGLYKKRKERGKINKDVTFEVCPLSLGSANSTDILGVPYLKKEKEANGKETEKVDIAVNGEFTDAIDRIDKALKEGKEHFVIFFFDEITNVTYTEVLNFLMKFTDEGILVNKRLPDHIKQHVLIAAAGNTIENSELAQFNKLPSPIMRRSTSIIDVTFSSKDFLKWSKGKLHPYVWGFLEQFPHYAYITLQKKQSDSKMEITPSKWFDVSATISGIQDETEEDWQMDEETLKELDPNMRETNLDQTSIVSDTLKATLGDMLGILFDNYLQHAQKLPSISELVEKGISVVPYFARIDAKGKEQGKDVQLNFGLLAAFLTSLQSNIETSIDTLRKNSEDQQSINSEVQQSIKKINALYDVLAKMIVADFKQINQNKGQNSEREKQNTNKEFKYFVNTETAVGLILPLLELLFQKESNSFVVDSVLSQDIYSSLVEAMQLLYDFDQVTFAKVSNLMREREPKEEERG